MFTGINEIYELSSKLWSAVQGKERSRKVADELGMNTEVKVKAWISDAEAELTANTKVKWVRGASVQHRDRSVASAVVVASIPRDSNGTSGAQDPSDASPHHPI